MCTNTKTTNQHIPQQEQQQQQQQQEQQLPKDEEWITKVNMKEFRKDIRALGEKLYKEQGILDILHLKKMIFWGNSLSLTGMLLSGFVPIYYLLPSLLLCFGNSCRWLMIAHHTCHGGYDNCDDGGPKDKHGRGRYHRFNYAVGSLYRRYMDWFDWILPEAWNVEHNNLHHYHLNELEYDPDFVPRNSRKITHAPIPQFFKYLSVVSFAMTWKWSYYAPNTWKELQTIQTRKVNPKLVDQYVNEKKAPPTIYDILEDTLLHGKPFPPFFNFGRFFTHVIGPYFLYRFFLLPLPFLLLDYYHANASDTASSSYYWNSVGTFFLSDLLANIHTYIMVVPNHAGSDLYWFTTHCKPKSSMFYLRQVIGSVNYVTNNSNVVDFCYGFLNYQIEHHLYPNLSMRSYQIAQPLVKELCNYHNVPYIEENVFLRVKKTVDVTVGNSEMKLFPEGFLPLNDDDEVDKSSKNHDKIVETVVNDEKNLN